MAQALRIAIPLISFVLVTLVGLSLTKESFAISLRNRRALLGGLLFPWLVVPLLGLMTAALLPMSPDFRLGFLLLAACPTGGMANLYCLLARAPVALSLTLTTASCLLSWAGTPALLWLFSRTSPGLSAPAVPAGVILLQAGLMLALPAALGMALRWKFEGAVARREAWLGRLGLCGVALLLALAIASSPRNFTKSLGEAAAPVALFTLGAFAGGEALGRLLRLDRDDRFALTQQFVVRNLAVATVISVNFLGKTEYAAFAAAYFCLQTPLLLVAVGLRRRLKG